FITSHATGQRAEPRTFRNRDLTWTPAHRLLAEHPDRLPTWRPHLQAIASSDPARGAQITRIWAASVLIAWQARPERQGGRAAAIRPGGTARRGPVHAGPARPPPARGLRARTGG